MNAFHISARVVAVTACLGLLAPSTPRAQAPDRSHAPMGSIVGVWTLNRDLSDAQQAPEGRGNRSGGPGRSGGYRGGGQGGGGRGGGGFGRGGGGGRGNPDDMARMRDAMRDISEPPARMTITQTESMVIVTTGEGRTTRLSTDGTKIKDESTGITRKTRWEAGTLVSEITGADPGTIIERYVVSSEPRRLTVTLEFEGGNSSRRPPAHRLYDAES